MNEPARPSLLGPSPEDRAAEQATCSAKGCRAAASWRLEWRNPRIHAESRRKTWVACDAHREHLATFLAARGFLRTTLPLE